MQNQTATTFDPGTMAYSTTYYWRIDEVSPSGTTTGAIWSFSTLSAPPPMGSNESLDNTVTAGDRTATFQLINGVVIKGGYAGFGQPDPDARDIDVYETFLSGDIGILGHNSDNSYHVVTGSGCDETAVLDGFTITAGNANSGYPNDAGGGMRSHSGSPTVINCSFRSNSALWGGGMENFVGSTPTIVNCTFSENAATVWEGGGINNNKSSPTVTNCTFSGNSARMGGGMNNLEGCPTITNCTFSGNSAELGGGGMNNLNSTPTITNCMFSGNSAQLGGGMWNEQLPVTVTNCVFSGNSAEQTGGGIYNHLRSNSTLTNCILWKNTAPSGSQIHNDGTSSATVTYSDVQGGWPGQGNIDADPCFVGLKIGEPPGGAIAHWKFNEGSGTTAYDSASSNHGTLNGNPNWVAGKIGPCALDLNGVSDCVEVPDAPSLDGMDALTITAWIKTDSSGDYMCVVSKYIHNSGDNLDDSYCLLINPSGAVIFQYNPGDVYVIKLSSPTVADGSWHHIVGVYTGTEGSIYIDGDEVPLFRPYSDPGGSLNNTDVQLTIGSSNNDGNVDFFFQGTIDDVRIYNQALSAEEIQQFCQMDYHLLPDSPCINRGDPYYPFDPNETDLDGKPRVIGGRIDMGAYEFNHIPVADAGLDRTVEAQAPWGATVTLDGSGSSDADSTPGTNDDINDCNWYELDPCDPNTDIFLGSGEITDCNLSIGEHIILLEVIDKAGAYDTNEVTIIVQDTTPPDINCPPDVTLECPADTTLSATGKATATDTCGTVTITHSDQWQPGCGNTGTLARTWTATDESGNSSTCVQTITVVDTTPPEFEFSVTPTMLWPPDHKMVEITPSWMVSDECDSTPQVSLVNIMANEGDDTIGDGHTSNDIQIGADGSIYLRSERSGTGTDRLYTITYQAVDVCGNTTVRSATVSIPHDFKVLARIASRWLWPGPGRIPEDLNGDGFVNLKDIAIFANNWIQ
jgi:predicted outer membrane repeat protein